MPMNEKPPEKPGRGPMPSSPFGRSLIGWVIVIAVGLSSPPGGRPKGPLGIGTAALEFLLVNAGDDPSTANVHIPIPVWGVLSLVSTGKRHRFMALGRQAAEQALPAIKALLE